MQARNSVGAVLGHHDRLVELLDPALHLGRERDLGLLEVSGLGVPPVVAVEAEHVEEVGDLVREVGREEYVGEGDRPA